MPADIEDPGDPAGRANTNYEASVVDRVKRAPPVDDAFDYSTLEAEQAMRVAIQLVLEVREFEVSPMARKVLLYERTLGFAVVPVLLRRAFIRLWGHRRPRSSDK